MASTAVLLGLSILAWFAAFNHRYREEKGQLVKRLANLTSAPGNSIAEELHRPFKERIILPIFQRVSQLGTKLVPAARRDNLERQLEAAGVSPVKAGSIAVLEFASGLVSGLTSALILTNQVHNYLLLSPLAMAAAALGMRIPKGWLSLKTRQRLNTISRELPDALDLMTVSVEAGLGLDGAMAKVAQTPGEFPKELKRALNEIRMGKPRKEALRDMAHRADCPELNGFVTAIIQAEQLGGSLGNILRVQASSVRQKRRQKIEEQAMKAPVKMLLPLVFCIFPSIFIVLLGPALINLNKIF